MSVLNALPLPPRLHPGSTPISPYMFNLQTLREALPAAALGVVIAFSAPSAALHLSERGPAKKEPRLRVMNSTAAQMETPRLRRRAAFLSAVE